jgi:hypothetical protein
VRPARVVEVGWATGRRVPPAGAIIDALRAAAGDFSRSPADGRPGRARP